MAVLPSELWSHAFSFLSVVNEAASSDPEVWARIVTGNEIHEERPTRMMIENNATKRALGLVCRSFYELSRPVALEMIDLRAIRSLKCLARTLREKPGLASVASRCTKRIDISISSSEQYYVGTIVAFQGIYGDLAFILRKCSGLVYFSLRTHEDILFDSGAVVYDLVRACPSLEVLRWHSTSLSKVELSSVLPKFSRLRVLDLSMSETEEFVTQETYELSFLHTLIGWPAVIFPHSLDIKLPSLRTLICRPGIGDDYEMSQFFKRHGKKIESLGFGLLLHESELVKYCSNVTELILDASISDLVELSWPNVRHLGIVMKIRFFSDNVKAAEMLLFTLVNIRLQRKMGNYARLQSVRILDDRAIRCLRERKMTVTRLFQRDLHDLSIRLEEHAGELLAPPSSRHAYLHPL